MSEPLTVDSLDADRESDWQAFLADSGTGTLFHDLGFLAYHPPGRFAFHHLVVHKRGRIAALVPGGLVTTDGGSRWRSPLGASIGGPVLSARPRLTEVLAVVEALQQHALVQGWAGIDITLPPAVYYPHVGDAIGFALFRHGFSERQRWLSPMIELGAVPAGENAVHALFEKRQVQALRAAQDRGVAAIETGLEGLQDFGRVFEDTFARHGVSPTHTLEDIETLMRRFPDRIRLVLARQDGGHVVAGVLVMQLTRSTATTFYICSSAERIRASGPLVALGWLIETLRTRGCHWLDLGPSASATSLNAGVMLFKEGLGAVAQCRTQWWWTT